MKVDRLLYFLLALVVGFGITFLITMLSNKTKGPLLSIAENVENFTYNLDYQMVLHRQEESRKERLNWFSAINTDKNSLMHYPGLLLGASDAFMKQSYETIFSLEDSLHTTFPLLHIYSAWGDKPEQQFPSLEVKVISDLGSTPVITWEPWITDFDAKKTAPNKPKIDIVYSMQRIAAGYYDNYIIEWAKNVKKFGKPLYLRWGHEMNDPTRYPWGTSFNQPEDYVLAWRHVHQIFKEQGANNVIWVWSPHLSYQGIASFYPGDDYVDMVGCTVLNYGNAVAWSDWWSIQYIFGHHYAAIQAFKKPIMIAEFGSLNEGGDRPEWYKTSFNAIADQYFDVKVLLFFNYSNDKTVSDKALNWSLNRDKQSLQILRDQIKSLKNSNRM